MEEECEVKAVLVRLEIFFKICGFTRFDLLDHFLKYMLDISKWFHFVFFLFMIIISTNMFFSQFTDLQDLIVLMTF